MRTDKIKKIYFDLKQYVNNKNTELNNNFNVICNKINKFINSNNNIKLYINND